MRTNYIDIKIATKNGWIDAKLYAGRPKRETPKSYKQIGVFRHNIGDNYNPHILTIYKNKRGELIYEIYRSGCFDPYFGKLECDYLKDRKE